MATITHAISPEDCAAMAELRKAAANITVTFDPASRPMLDEMLSHTPPAPGVTSEAATVGGVPGYWVRPTDVLPNAAILYLHGGAYNVGSAGAFRNFVGQIATRAGVAAFAAEYRLAPEHPFPAAVNDVMAAYHGVINEGFTEIAIVGDSAGGGLTLVTLAQAIEMTRDAGEIQPRCAVVMSPWTDLSLSGASITERALADPFLKHDSIAAASARYLNGHDARDPLASPLFGGLTGLPPIRIHVGEDEILLDDSRRYAKRATAEGVEIELHIWEGMPHVFPSNVGTFAASEIALDDIGAFLRQHLSSL
ncbi:MAG: alpha/beta hydrolase [Capsulimonas sp.]|uniref:alpha/beta hydrolase n=1 Tax=Capsulimonas sp. TaxID=2494211 RepID=UPI003264FE3D